MHGTGKKERKGKRKKENYHCELVTIVTQNNANNSRF
jgi:hypothetical protein